MAARSQAPFWSEPPDSPRAVGIATIPQEAVRRREQARSGFFQSLYSPPKLSWQILYPLTSPQAITQGRQRFVLCSKNITTGLQHDPLIISRTLNWRNVQQITMVWQSHGSTLYSPDLWARGCADAAVCLLQGVATAVWTRALLCRSGWTGYIQHPACYPGLNAHPDFFYIALKNMASLSCVQSFSSPHVCLQPWKKVKLGSRREKSAITGILSAGWGRIQTDQRSSMSHKIAQNLTEISLILKINKSQLTRGYKGSWLISQTDTWLLPFTCQAH